ncbi:MAG: T9SS type A sorting domain-containing protein, partial [Saprospiraceae bacterium]
GINYYRLRQEDADGQRHYSAVRSVLVDALADEWAVFPNPLSIGQTLLIRTIQEEAYRFRLFDVSGKKLVEKIGSGAMEIENLGLPAGVYGYEITGERKRATGKLMVK